MKGVSVELAKKLKEEPSGFVITNRRYIGGKSLLIENIFKAIPEKYKGGVFCDIFAGTGVVGTEALKTFSSVIFNDLLFSNEVIYKGFHGKGTFNLAKLNNFVNEATTLSQSNKKANYFSSNFGGKYFSVKTARDIGFIRESIAENKHNFNGREQAILISSLIYSADRVANTVGHYEAFRQNIVEFKDFSYKLISPVRKANARIFREDANELARSIKADVVYIDPPYNSRQYSRFYHVLENLTKWEKPALTGVALKPPTENISDYCKVEAPNAFADLIKNLNAKLIIVSYNNTYNSKSKSSQNKITLEQITKILKSRGSTKVKKIKHKFFSAGNTDFDEHFEYIFITEVKS
jgi:adenine-specific DNA-methyltransferase